MIIAYLGNFGLSWCTESHLANTLEDMGEVVVRLQENRITAAEVPDRVRAVGAQLFIWQRTMGWLRGDTAEMLRKIPCPTVAYHLDLYAGLKRSRDIDEHPWWRCDHVFSADGGSEAFWLEHGIKHHWMPPGVFRAGCYLAEPGDRRYDVIFVGSGPGYHDEWPWRGELVEWLAKTYAARFTRFGRGAEVECIREAPLNVLYASTKVVVGDSLCLGYKHPRYWSDRIPETLGRGGFLVHPHIDGLAEHYEPGRHLVTFPFGDFDCLKRTIDYYLEHDEERERIRLEGHEHTKTHHTYHQRMRQMLNALIAEGVIK